MHEKTALAFEAEAVFFIWVNTPSMLKDFRTPIFGKEGNDAMPEHPRQLDRRTLNPHLC